jgi:hypothetical protein
MGKVVNSDKYTDGKILGSTYSSIERPIAKEMLEFAKTIDPKLKMITTAVREWAEAWNEAFDFGFEEIYSREDFTQTTSRIYGGEATDNNDECLNIECGCIIDNYRWNDPSPMHKMQFVFGEAKKEYWIHLQAFSGHTDERWKTADLKRLDQMKKDVEECMRNQK